MNACLYPLCAVHGKAVTTVEGIGSTKTKLHAVQVSFSKANMSVIDIDWSKKSRPPCHIVQHHLHLVETSKILASFLHVLQTPALKLRVVEWVGLIRFLFGMCHY